LWRLDRRHVGFVERDGRAVERARRVAALAFDLQLGARHERVAHVVRRGLVADLDGRRRRTRGLERLGDDDCHVLPVVADDVVVEGRARFVDVARINRISGDAEEAADVAAMQDRAHARHPFGGGEFERRDPAARDGAANRHCMQAVRASRHPTYRWRGR